MTSNPDVLVSELVTALRGVLARVAEPDKVLATLLQQAVSLTGAKRGVLVEVSPRGELAFSVLHSYNAEQLHDPGHYSRGIFATCLRTGDDVRLDNACQDLPANVRRTAEKYKIVSVLCMPVRVGDRVAALVHLEHPVVGHFLDSHRQQVRPLLDLAAPVLEALAAGRAVLEDRDRIAQEAEESRALLAQDWSFGRFVGRCATVRELERVVRQAAAAPYPVLLTGETGTGKSILARILHSASARAPQPFVTVFCPSLERSMVESELFGHRRGAFTGAVTDQVGKVRKAEGGTLFLDEIGVLPIEIQPKLLRLLQERTYERLGDAEERRADVRVIAATNLDLELEVEKGRFRRDLFERLNFVPIGVPALRERREDIPLILRHCLDQTESGRWIEVGDEVSRYLEGLDFAWPGNVRVVEQLAARMTLEGSRRPITVADVKRLMAIREEEPALASSPPPTAQEADGGLPRRLEDAERTWLEEYLRRYPHLTRAELAARLQIGESSLYKKLRRYGLGADR